MTSQADSIERLFRTFHTPAQQAQDKMAVYLDELSAVKAGILDDAISGVIREWDKNTLPPIGVIFKQIRALQSGMKTSGASGGFSDAEDAISLEVLRNRAEARLERLGIRETENSLRHAMRALLASKVRLTHEGYLAAVEQGLVSRDNVPFHTMNPQEEIELVRLLQELHRAGRAWCGVSQCFVEQNDVLEPTAWKMDRSGLAYFKGPSLGAARAAVAALEGENIEGEGADDQPDKYVGSGGDPGGTPTGASSPSSNLSSVSEESQRALDELGWGDDIDF